MEKPALKWIGRLIELSEDWGYWARRDGWFRSIPRIGQDFVRLPYRRMHFFILVRPLQDTLPDIEPKIPLEIREFTPSDVDLVRQIDRPSEARVCVRRLAHGHKGFIALSNGQPAGHAWACTQIEPTIERVQPKLRPGDFLQADAYTAPVFRGKGVHTALALARFRLFQGMGYRRGISYIEKVNAPSLKVARRTGWRVVGEADLIRVGPWRWVKYEYHSSVESYSWSSSTLT